VEIETNNIECFIQGTLSTINLLSYLPTRRTNGREPLLNYLQSHVVTFNQYLNIMQQKAIEKEIKKQSSKIEG
jgi:hypothetical protein